MNVESHSRFRHGALQEMKCLMRVLSVLAIQPEPSVRFHDTEYLRKCLGFILYPIKNAIQINSVKACVGKFGQILGSADPRLEIAGCLRLSDFDSQRQRINADN